MPPINSAYAYYVNAGWCAGCGRKRDRDGSCSNCDRWYHSPLILAGGPLVLGMSLLLYIGISILRPEPRPALAAAPPASAAPLLTTAAAGPGRPGVYSGFSPALAPPPAVVTAPASPLPGVTGFQYRSEISWQEAEERRAQAQFLQMEALRNAAAQADALMAAEAAARHARERAALLAATRPLPSQAAALRPQSGSSNAAAPRALPSQEMGNPAAVPLVW